jgi:hypothetical protein
MIATFARMGHNVLLAAFALITIAFVLAEAQPASADLCVCSTGLKPIAS